MVSGLDSEVGGADDRSQHCCLSAATKALRRPQRGKWRKLAIPPPFCRPRTAPSFLSAFLKQATSDMNKQVKEREIVGAV